jgi:hypothetical protein
MAGRRLGSDGGDSVNPPIGFQQFAAGLVLALAPCGVVAQADFAAWAAGWFGAAERAAGAAAPRQDPDRDGWPNLLEYLLGTGPLAAQSAPRPGFAAGGGAAVCCALGDPRPDAGLRVLVSGDLSDWVAAAPAVLAGGVIEAPLGAGRFVCFEAFGLPGVLLDSDGDGLHDLFEEALVAADPDDALEGIGAVAPDDDFDGDGVANRNEPGNQRPDGCGHLLPPLLDPAAVAAAADRGGPPAVTALAVHTPLDD